MSKSDLKTDTLVTSNSLEDQKVLEAPINEVPFNEDEAYLDKKGVARLYRKIDWRLLPCMGVLFLLAGIDRGAVSNASIFGFKESLGIDTTQYNLIATCFFFTYALFEVPANMVLTKVRPSIWLSGLCFTWGVVMTLSGLVKNFGGAVASRLALGVAEAGFFPGAIYLLSLWYRREMMTYRISIFYSSATLSLAFSGLLAYAINGLKGAGGLESWRWIFLIEGMATCLIAVGLYFAIPNSPSDNRFLSAEESKYLTQSTMAPTFASKPLRDDLFKALKDWRNWCQTWMLMAGAIPTYGFAYTLPSVLVQLGYAAQNAQLLTVPLYVFACLFTIAVSILVERKDSRSLGAMISFGTAFVGIVVTAFLPKTQMPGLRYGFLFPVLGGCYAAAPCILAWSAANSAGPQKRAITSALNLTLSNLSSAIGTNMFLAREVPEYRTGFGIAIALLGSGFFMSVFLRLTLSRENKRRDQMDKDVIAQVHTQEELEHLGDLSPLFRYKL